eukprot:3930980-Alexandrium_andersonii.AAC.1
MAVYFARTTLNNGPPPGTLADILALGARPGIEEQRVMYELQVWWEMECLRWSADGTRFEFALAPGPRSVWDPLAPPPDDFSTCRVVLLSSFD